MDSSIISLIIAGTFALIIGFGFILMLILNHQKRILQKNREMFLAVMKTQELEQQRIGKDLHDSISPLISSIRQRAGKIELMIENGKSDLSGEFEKLDELLRNSALVVREASHNLMPVALKNGLNAVLDDYVKASDHPNLQVKLYNHNFPERLAEIAEIQLYRIVQELVHNAIKYSQGSEIKVYLFSFQQNDVQIIVRDNGKGMSDKSGEGMGHKNLENRLKLLEGSSKFYTTKPSGLGIHLKFDSRKWK